MMEAVSSTETSIYFYHTTWYNRPENIFSMVLQCFYLQTNVITTPAHKNETFVLCKYYVMVSFFNFEFCYLN